ncbi:MAG: NAD-dependent epimerase [Desulfovibrionaceae bacterium]|nr:NAD-dependent epimerase [Desulfovibrionaceae bacterium]
MKVLLTGAAGFIGFHLARVLLERGAEIVGIDNLNDYYSVRLKEDRLALLTPRPGFHFMRGDLADAPLLNSLFADYRPTHVINLAAQAGVRYSLVNPQSYIQSNLVGFANVLECCRHHPVEHLVFASSSSVYGLNGAMPYRVEDNVDHPASLYAATKKSNELMAHAYSHLYGIPCTGLRFFTVYGPWGRPDMAPHLFASAILAGRPIKVFNEGHMRRDFTCIDDIVEGVIRLLSLPPGHDPHWDARHPHPGTSPAPWRVFNIGNHEAVGLMEFIHLLEEALGREAVKEFLPMQPGDVEATYADVDELSRLTGFAPHTPLREGLRRFVDWHVGYYGVTV